MLKKITGSQIKDLRKLRGLTQQELAERANISQAHVARIENDAVNPRLSAINAILEVLFDQGDVRCGDIMTKRIISLNSQDSVIEGARKMIAHDFSQLPVIDGDQVVGTVTEKCIIRILGGGPELSLMTVADIMEDPPPLKDVEERIEDIQPLFEKHQAVIVLNLGKPVGIVSRADIVRILGKI